MSFTLGGVTVGAREQPYEWDFGDAGEQEWAEANCYGFNGRIMRRRHIDANEMVFRMRLTNATRASFQAMSDVGDSVTFLWDDTDIGGTTMTVTIKKFHPRKNRDTYLRVPAAVAVWDCELVLVA